MKKLILGHKGIGKTTLIVNEFIPQLKNNYLIFDFCDEYSQWIQDKSKIKNFYGIVGKELKDQVISTIKETDDDITLIIDNTQLLRFANDFHLVNFSWLYDYLKNKKFINVFQSIKSISEGEVPDVFDDIYYFPTRDDDKVIISYLDWQIAEGKNVMIMNELFAKK